MPRKAATLALFLRFGRQIRKADEPGLALDHAAQYEEDNPAPVGLDGDNASLANHWP